MRSFRTHLIAASSAFALGVFLATPHWSRHYLTLGGALVLLFVAVANVVLLRRDRPSSQRQGR